MAKKEFDKATVREEAILRKRWISEFEEKLKKGEVEGKSGKPGDYII